MPTWPVTVSLPVELVEEFDRRQRFFSRSAVVVEATRRLLKKEGM